MSTEALLECNDCRGSWSTTVKLCVSTCPPSPRLSDQSERLNRVEETRWTMALRIARMLECQNPHLNAEHTQGYVL